MTVNIRVAAERDAVAVCGIYSPIVKETAISFEYRPPTVEEMRERIGETLERYPFLVFEDGGKVVGYAYATAHRKRDAYRWAAETSVFVDPGHRRSGVGRALYKALLHILRAQGYCHAFAVITVPNPPSIAFHESLGFSRLATFRNVGFKLGFWRDTGWWHLLLQELPDAPAPPKPFAAARTSANVKRALETAQRMPR
jgi:phosphinothricin acetyltransferase